MMIRTIPITPNMMPVQARRARCDFLGIGMCPRCWVVTDEADTDFVQRRSIAG
jgi:hypothetical protein